MYTYSDTYKENVRGETVQLGEDLGEDKTLCMTYSDRKHIFPTMLKQSRLLFWHGNIPLPVLQSVVPLFAECYYGFNPVVVLVCNLTLGFLLLRKGNHDSNHMFNSVAVGSVDMSWHIMMGTDHSCVLSKQ